MDLYIPRNFELRIIHDSKKSEVNTVHCTVLPKSHGGSRQLSTPSSPEGVLMSMRFR